MEGPAIYAVKSMSGMQNVIHEDTCQEKVFQYPLLALPEIINYTFAME